jgi:nucleotide-binding universal stress UspA family protein
MADVIGRTMVVGVDGSDSALRAVEWATATAARRGLPVDLVYVNSWPTDTGPMWPTWGPQAGNDSRTAAREILADAARRAAATERSVTVTADIVEGGTAAVLLDRSQRAALLVLGRRGTGGFPDLLLGSTAAQVATYASCPVVVVPENAHQVDAEGPGVVLGVDGSEECQAAIGYAFDEASMRQRPLTAVRSYYWPSDDPAIVEPFPPLPEDHLAEQRRLISEALAGWAERYPHVKVHTWVAHRRPARALVEAAHHADLLVVGARGTGGFRGLMLGSVAELVIRHGTCPVLVTRKDA